MCLGCCRTNNAYLAVLSLLAGTWHGLVVAVKVIILPACEAAATKEHLQARAAALREAALSVSLSHPHLLTTLDVHMQPLTVQPQPQPQADWPGSVEWSTPYPMAADAMHAAAGGVGAWRLFLVQVRARGGITMALQCGGVTMPTGTIRMERCMREWLCGFAVQCQARACGVVVCQGRC